ncbi:adenylate/guanylate cyclase domain-containing protein [Phyllobacterium sp. 628]|uniref:adenylate/guanylate cyclase domain-containing protein n=1 Tax=Phyllobacterium sp. 628 TaxID=2718938 RepID=UPI001AED32FE|nr:adenylate/guanylate cyclase domain-containing protein [Phyllobacterium sp. 628]
MSSDDPEKFVAALAVRMVDYGVPLYRLQISAPSLHPLHQVFSTTWYSGGPLLVETFEHGPVANLELEQSPVNHLLSQNARQGRWDLREPANLQAFPLLLTLAQNGCTDYVLRLIDFAPGTAIAGMSISITTTQPSRFSEEDVAYLDAVLPALGLAIFRMAVSRMASDVLGFYVGAQTSNRILGGDIQRGEGQAIFAAILLADLKSFTALNELHAPKDIVQWLNEHFEVIGAAIEAHGGEILKLMGDSILAIFPVQANDSSTSEVCREALAAAQNAIAATSVLNQSRIGGPAPQIGVDVVLHLGEVFYGNIGAARRLDFTVIGRAVNETARIEALCDPLNRNLLLSSSFAEHCGAPTEVLGTFNLRGVAQPQAIFGVRDSTSQT